MVPGHQGEAKWILYSDRNVRPGTPRDRVDDGTFEQGDQIGQIFAHWVIV
jgi:hypothetical protein